MSTLPTSSACGPEPVWDIAKLFPPQGQWSVEEYLSLTRGTNHLIELSDGHLEVLEMPTLAHQRILRYLFTLLSRFVNDRDLGEVLFAALPVQVSATTYREPDILYLRRGVVADPHESYVKHADLVMEIVSPDDKSRVRDLITKRKEYAAAGIREYWIIDPDEKRITVLALERAEYAEAGNFGPGEQAASQLLVGFVVNVESTFKAAELTK